jgi:hypothetical protein
VKKHLERQFGVQSVDVSLMDGKVAIIPKEDGPIDPPQLLKAVYDSGVSVAEMDVTAEGKLVRDSSGNLALSVSPTQSFLISPNGVLKELEPLANHQTTVMVRGQLYKKPEGKRKGQPDTSAPLKLAILEIQRKE